MLSLRYIPPPTPARYGRLEQEVSQNPQQLKADQHVVSRVLLDQFAEPVGPKGERKVSILNRAYMHAKPTARGPAGCGKFRHFVRYASDSSEAAWMATETRLREALDAADNGTFFDRLRHSDTVRDAIVLHLVRSIPMLIVSDQTWRNRHTAHVDQWMRHGRDALFWMHRARFGWSPSSDQELQVMAEDLISRVATQMDSGLYFRVTVVERFQRFSRMLADEPVELRRPASGELLISDVPALALRDGYLGTGPLDGLGLANCDELVLPLGPRLMAVLGAGHGYTTMGTDDVDRYNTAQVRAAADYVYLRPGSGLETFARAAGTPQWPNRIPLHLRQGDLPATFLRQPEPTR
ncbi:DUF4238 domain-containing protein [Actinacidiphila oryziradicis]|uniref:DUF4238 domain-containing protein n=1 Tax=Actinacidiphila oryziradicis TaxID=2571141 RepID=A0A4U0RV16_9ACTN|nr:DUF4238 domain-containing protein [Actinacidiphila oryziradicis]TJZ99347.1 hypothetical protein FCI23_46185 [Actinacidiphila oryziradicis]